MEVQLRDLARVITKGTTPKTAGYAFEERGVPFLRAEDIAGVTLDLTSVGKRISDECHAAFRRSQIESGDVLVTIAGTIGRVAVMPSSSITANCNQAVAIVKLKAECIDPQYLLYALRSPKVQGQLRQQGTTATIMNVSLSQIGDLRVPCPPKAEQTRVVEMLSRAENIVRMRREAEQKAKEIIPALFLDMFAGGNHANEEGRAGHRGPAHTSNAGSGSRVETARKVKLGDLVSRFEGGKNVQAGAEGASNYRILKISAVTSGNYDETQAKPAPGGFEPPKHYFVRTGDLLFSRANTEELVGATALVEATDGRSLLPDKLWRFVWRDLKQISPLYMLALLQTRNSRIELSKIASGTGGSMKNISQAKLSTLEVTVAPLAEQRQFERHALKAKGIASSAGTAAALAEYTFQSLLAGAFRTAGQS